MAAPPKTTTKPRARTGGGFTLYRWNFGAAKGGSANSTTQTQKPEALLFAHQVTDQSPAPVGPGTVAIHPMDATHPDHLITPGAISMGTLTLEFYELIDQPFWATLAGLEKSTDLADIFNALAGQDLMITKHIMIPGSRNVTATRDAGEAPGQLTQARQVEYHGCVVSNLLDGETVEVGTMEILKQVVINYTHITRDAGGGGKPIAAN